MVSTCKVDCEQSLKERSLRKDGLQTTQEEMKYALPTHRKIPICQNQCFRQKNHVGNRRIQAVSNGKGFVPLPIRFDWRTHRFSRMEILRRVGNAYFISSCVACSFSFHQLLSFKWQLTVYISNKLRFTTDKNYEDTFEGYASMLGQKTKVGRDTWNQGGWSIFQT